MRDDRTLLSPQKANRRIKFNAERNQKNQKSSSRKDSLDISTLSEVSEENHVVEITESTIEDSFDTSTFSAVSEDNNVTESTKRFTTYSSPLDSPPSVHGPSPSSGITLLSSTSSHAAAEPSNLYVNRIQSDSEVAGFLEVELVVKHLTQLMLHTQNSADTDLRYKKLLDGLVKIVIEEFCRLREEKDWLTEIISRRSHRLFVNLICWGLVLSTLFLFISRSARSTYSGPPPT